MSVGVWNLNRPFQLDLWKLGAFSISFLLRAATKRSQAACPQCVTPLKLSKNHPSRIDACGFETYTVDCSTCLTRLDCFVDPTDDALILSRAAP